MPVSDEAHLCCGCPAPSAATTHVLNWVHGAFPEPVCRTRRAISDLPPIGGLGSRERCSEVDCKTPLFIVPVTLGLKEAHLGCPLCRTTAAQNGRRLRKGHGREGEGTEEGAGCCFSRSFCQHLVVPTLGQALFRMLTGTWWGHGTSGSCHHHTNNLAISQTFISAWLLSAI